MPTRGHRPHVALLGQVAKDSAAMDTILPRDLRHGTTVCDGGQDARPQVEVLGTHTTLLSTRSIAPSQSPSKTL